MPIIYDLRKDIRFKEGKEEGLEEGELKKARIAAMRFLKKGMLSPVAIAEGLDVPLSFVILIQEELEKNPKLSR